MRHDARAHPDFDRAIKANAHFDAALNNRGMAYKSKGELERAVKDFDQALAHRELKKYTSK